MEKQRKENEKVIKCQTMLTADTGNFFRLYKSCTERMYVRNLCAKNTV